MTALSRVRAALSAGERPADEDVREVCVLVCGGRDYSDYATLSAFLDGYARDHQVVKLVHGAASGADKLAGRWARERGIPVREFPADWVMYGKAAGPIRNRRMLDEGRADVVIAFPGGWGTADMIRQAADRGIPIIDAAIREPK